LKLEERSQILSNWFQKPLGKAVSQAVQEQWEAANFVRFNGDWLQCGEGIEWSQTTSGLFHNSPVILSPCQGKKVDVRGDFESLPFLSQSFSLVFLPFILEMFYSLDKLMDEVERVLTRDGYVLICGINPLSLWGASRIFSHNAIWPFSPIYWHTSLSIRQQLSSRGFETHWIRSFFYRPPLGNADYLQKTLLLEAIGRVFWPYPGGLYLLLAQKYVHQILPVKPLWDTGRYVIGKRFA